MLRSMARPRTGLATSSHHLPARRATHAGYIAFLPPDREPLRRPQTFTAFSSVCFHVVASVGVRSEGNQGARHSFHFNPQFSSDLMESLCLDQLMLSELAAAVRGR